MIFCSEKAEFILVSAGEARERERERVVDREYFH